MPDILPWSVKKIRAFSFNREVRRRKRKEIDLAWKIKLLEKEIEAVRGGRMFIYLFSLKLHI